jgi:protein tyrosine/serine phosphatase
VTHARELTWDGCLNVRDLGGHTTADGGETRFGAIVRADSVRQLSADGWRALVDYGVTTVVDLRGDEERDEDPPAELAVDVIHAPFVEASEQERRQVDAEVGAVTTRHSSGAARTRGVYVIFLEHFRKNVAHAVRAVAHAPEGGVVIHCVGGKDRTGLLTALLLHVAGVEVEEIAADYALSEERLRPRTQAWLDAAETEAERDEIVQISRTPAEVIVGVFHELERRYGSVEGYLRAAGVGEEDLARVRARLRG